MQLRVEEYLWHHFPRLEAMPNLFKKVVAGGARKLFHEDSINQFLEQNKHKDTFSFMEAILEFFVVDVSLHANQLARIPSYGRLVIIANHPLGALDAIALMHTIKSVRKDIKIVANSFLAGLDNLSDAMIPVDNISGRMHKETLSCIYGTLKNEQAVIIFPSGEVSRVKPHGIKDTPWQSGFYKIASKMQAPILPIYIKAKNSNTFYILSILNKSLATATLPHEMFKHKGKKIEFNIGKVIPPESYNLKIVSTKEMVKLFRKHFYKVSKNGRPIFKTQNEISIAEDRSELKHELKKGELLGNTSDGKSIILYDSEVENCIIREIGRLREISFRFVGEGSGKKRDIDSYDLHYKHLIIWDDENLEIAGAYRLALGSETLDNYGIEGLYTHELFEYSGEFEKYIRNGIELGRSFVQPKYWNSRALDYLWQGIGAYISKNSHIRYLFGAVSLSDSLNPKAKAMLVYLYSHYFKPEKKLVQHRVPYSYPFGMLEHCQRLFMGKEYKEDIKILKEELSFMGYAIPTLYKQYADICEESGVKFFDFGHDKNFNSCIDGFIMADMSLIKESKKKRYYA
ncbi:MAG: GNAT family N-acetyltransferase [Sulfurovum sp.]|nr:GNAT family N-acetyltransferase [Sulfurovum sp.]